MTVQLNLPLELVDRFIEAARLKGLSLDDYLLQTILGNETQNGSNHFDEQEARRACEEAGRSIRELSKGNVLGPDLTIRDLIEEGRRY